MAQGQLEEARKDIQTRNDQLTEARRELREAEVGYSETIRYMAENCHQAHHQDQTGGWWMCQRNVCNAAQQALPGLVLWLSGKGPKP